MTNKSKIAKLRRFLRKHKVWEEFKENQRNSTWDDSLEALAERVPIRYLIEHAFDRKKGKGMAHHWKWLDNKWQRLNGSGRGVFN